MTTPRRFPDITRPCACGCGRTVARGNRRLKDTWYAPFPACKAERERRRMADNARRAGVPQRVAVPCEHCAKPAYPTPGEHLPPLGVLCSRPPCRSEYQRRRAAKLTIPRQAENCDHCGGPWRQTRPGPVGRYGRLCSKPACRAEYTRLWTIDRRATLRQEKTAA